MVAKKIFTIKNALQLNYILNIFIHKTEQYNERVYDRNLLVRFLSEAKKSVKKFLEGQRLGPKPEIGLIGEMRRSRRSFRFNQFFASEIFFGQVFRRCQWDSDLFGGLSSQVKVLNRPPDGLKVAHRWYLFVTQILSSSKESHLLDINITLYCCS